MFYVFHLISVAASSSWIAIMSLVHLLIFLVVLTSERSKLVISASVCLFSDICLRWRLGASSCLSGAADEASIVFGEAAARCMQKQYLHHGLASQSLHVSNEDRNFASARNFFSLEDASPRQLKHMQGNNIRDNPGNYHNNAILGGASTQFLTGSSSNVPFYNTPSPMATQVWQSVFYIMEVLHSVYWMLLFIFFN